MAHDLTRREVLAAGGAVGAAAFLASPLVQEALATTPAACSTLAEIEHVIFLIQENRTFDHYFGTYRGVRGFSDPDALHGVFAQQGYPAAGYGGQLLPFHLDSSKNGECTNNLTHEWGPQHQSWDNGAMDDYVRTHLAADGSPGAQTMGFYERADLPLHYALADAFTLCDGYHSSVLGPSDPNHVMSISATIDPAGVAGGPIVTNFSPRESGFAKLSWTTMPEQLQNKGISWKVYSLDNLSPVASPAFEYFKQYYTKPALAARALVPSFPVSYLLDIELGRLPAVSWVYNTILQDEHPPSPPDYGEVAISQLLGPLFAKPELWAKTVVFITYDDSGGYFDHVPPPVPPAGTPGEYLTVSPLPSAASGVSGPIGLGNRVPLLVVSPFSRGGFVCSDVFDHTSMLRFLETRFGTEVPNLSAWRRGATGDLTSTLNMVAPNANVPTLPKTSLVDPKVLASDCPTEAIVSLVNQLPGASSLSAINALVPPYPVPPPPQQMPAQEAGTAPAPSGCTGSPPPPTTRRRGLLATLLHLLGL